MAESVTIITDDASLAEYSQIKRDRDSRTHNQAGSQQRRRFKPNSEVQRRVKADKDLALKEDYGPGE